MKKLLSILAFLTFANLGFGAVAVSDTKISQATSASPVAWKDVIIVPSANTLLGWDNSKVASGVSIGTSLSLSGGSLNTSQGLRTADSPTFVDVTLGTSGPSVKSSLAARAPRQGLVFNGTAGATVSGVPALGTTYTLVAWMNPTNVTGAKVAIANASQNALYISGATVYTAGGSAGLTVTAAKNQIVAISNAAGTATPYLNGVAGTPYAEATSLLAIDKIGSDGSNHWSGTLNVLIYNRALSAAEVLALAESGNFAASDVASAGTKNTVGFGNSVVPYDSITAASETGFTAVQASGPAFANSAPTFTIRAGDYVRVSGVSVRNNGKTVFPSISLADSDGTSRSATATLSADGAFSVSITATSASTGCVVWIGSTGDADITLSGVSVDVLGLLFAMDPAQPGNGYQYLDVSGNKADATIPASGVSWALPSAQGTYTVRASLTWAGTHEAKSLLGQVAIPANAQITSIVTEATAGSAGAGLTVGSVTTPALFVSANSYTTAKESHALAAVFPAGTATNDLSLVLDPDDQNYTGTIQITVNYILTR